LNATVVKEGVYQLLVHIWLKVMVFLTANRFNLVLTWWTNNVKIFKLEEEKKLALLLHLLKVFAETAVSTSASGLGCWLVVASPQARAGKTDDF
jgi:hypothetical protein